MSVNNILSTAKGLDSAIQSVQTDLFDYFSTEWSGDMGAYGRVHKNPANVGDKVPDYYRTSKIVTPEWYNAEKKDYEEVYFDDNFSSVICFLVGDRDTTKDGILYIAKVKCVFMLDLSQAFPSETERQDARAQNDVLNYMLDNNNGRYLINGVERGIDTIFYEYKTRSFRFGDMQPFHCFSVNIDLPYNLKC